MTEERRNKILEIIGESGYITIEELSQRMFLSPSTTRRNLCELEKTERIKRSYGGVELLSNPTNISVNQRFRKNHLEKRIIAGKAAQKITENATIFVDASSTCLHMASYLKDFHNLTVYTNGVELCSELSQSNVTVYSTGGLLVHKSMAFTGAHAEHLVKSIYFDALFFSCSGYSNGIVTDYSESEAILRRTLINQTDKVYFLCDSSKFGLRYTYIVCNKDHITETISN